jgi:cytochrome b
MSSPFDHSEEIKAHPDARQAAGVVSVRVWDLGVRLFHWTLLGCVVGMYVTGYLAPRQWFDAHLILGTLIGALIVYRITWGFLGSTHARFRDFVVSPFTALRHAYDLARGRAHHHIGHNPIGAVMIMALLLTLIILTVTGVIALGGILKDGPLAPFTSYAMGLTAKQAHEWTGIGLLGLIALHVLGVVAESLRTKENLVGSMVSGLKHASETETVFNATQPHRVLATVLVCTTLGALAWPILHFSQAPALGVPAPGLDAAYVKECSSCHAPHHPSLASAATWTTIIATLDNHFGDNAELDVAVSQSLLGYLVRNSAETWDTEAAHRLRQANAAGSLRITETSGWQGIHRHLDSQVFKTKAVGGKLNCAACHADAAAGLFKPRSIAIPKE